MTQDSAFLARYPQVADLLLKVSDCGVSLSECPYLGYIGHKFQDGDLSLIPLITKLKGTENLYKEEVYRAICILKKVNPEEWPEIESIESIDSQALIDWEEDPGHDTDYAETEIELSEKTQLVLKAVIEKVFGEPIDGVRDRQGNYPSDKNNFLRKNPDKYVGSFRKGSYTFEFEVKRSSTGWSCTYRLTAGSLDKVPTARNVQRKAGEFVRSTTNTKRSWS